MKPQILDGHWLVKLIVSRFFLHVYRLHDLILSWLWLIFVTKITSLTT